jgi:hypothetical protein
MNQHADKDQLLAEVLAPPPDFRATLLAETLRLARRRRHFRQARQVVGALALLGWLVVFVARPFSTSPTVSPPLARPHAKPSFTLVCTQPLPAAAIVSSGNFSATGWATAVTKPVEIVTTSGGFHLINDSELLALLAGKPAILIRTGPQTEELVFANPEDRRALLGN